MKKLLIILLALMSLACTCFFVACNNDDNTEKKEEPAHTHAYVDFVIAPTCTEKGYTSHKCACGDEKKDNYVEAKGHISSDWIIDKVASEAEEGSKHKECLVCKATLETEKIDKVEAGHTHEYTTTVVEPTCTEKGYTLHKCSCGDEYIDNYTEAKGHSYSTEWSKDDTYHWKTATCEHTNEVKDKAVHKYVKGVCVCGKKEGELIPVYTCEMTIDGETGVFMFYEAGVVGTMSEGELSIEDRELFYWVKEDNLILIKVDVEHRLLVMPFSINENGTTLSPYFGEDKTPLYTLDHLFDDNDQGIFKFFDNGKCLVVEYYNGKLMMWCYFDYVKEGNELIVADLGVNGKFNINPDGTISIEVHVHDFVETVVEPTCTEQGYTLHKCACGTEYKDNYVDPLWHSFTNYVSDDNATCISHGTKTAKCDRCDETDTITDYESPMIDHVYENGVCKVCGKKELKPSEGLKYILINNGLEYEVSGKGTCTDTDIVIPSTRNDKPVVGIRESVFSYCTNLKSVLIPSSVISIGEWAFASCSKLESVTFEENSKLISIGESAFRECSSLSEIIIPSSVTSIGESAFNNCSSLSSILIPSSVTSIGRFALACCNNLVNIEVEEGNKEFKSIDGNLYNIDATTLIKYAPGKRDTSFIIPLGVTSIGEAFYYCSSLSSIIIPASVTSIGRNAFTQCVSLKSIEIPSNVTSIGEGAFYSCSSLVTLKFEKTSKLVDIGEDAFGRCTSLESLEIPSSVVSIGIRSFSNCSSLEIVTVEENSRLTTIGAGSFDECSGLSIVIIPSSVKSIGGSVFWGCRSLESITYKGTVAQWQSISKGNWWRTGVPSSCIVHCSNGDVNINNA